MVWLESPKSQLFKTFCGLKIGWILRKLWAKCAYALFPSSTYIVLQPLGVFDLSLTSSTCLNMLKVWLESPMSQLFKTFCRLKFGWILRKLWAKMCVYALFPSLTSLTYIVLQPLGVFDLSLTSLTCFNIHSMVEKPYVSAFQNFFRIENPLNIKEVMSKNMFVCILSLWSIIHSIWHIRHLQHE